MSENEKMMKELQAGIAEQQHEAYEDLLKFVNKLNLHELRKFQLIAKIDNLVESFGGIVE